MSQFAKLSLTHGSIPDETMILNFRHLLEKHDIANASGILELSNGIVIEEEGAASALLNR